MNTGTETATGIVETRLSEERFRSMLYAEYEHYRSHANRSFIPTHIVFLTGPWNKGFPDNTFECELSISNVARILHSTHLANIFDVPIINCGEDVQIPWTRKLISSMSPDRTVIDIDSGVRNVSNSRTQFVELTKWAQRQPTRVRLFIVSDSYHGMRVCRYATHFLTPLGVQWQFQPICSDHLYGESFVEQEITKVVRYASKGDLPVSVHDRSS